MTKGDMDLVTLGPCNSHPPTGRRMYMHLVDDPEGIVDTVNTSIDVSMKLRQALDYSRGVVLLLRIIVHARVIIMSIHTHFRDICQ